MTYYFAPMEGITGFILRNAHHETFPGITKYFAPFIATNPKGSLKKGEYMDLIPSNNEKLCLVPQILTNRAEDFLATEQSLRDLGYDELNLNLGCPSRTVTSKMRGAGFLAEPELLTRFLDQVFSRTQCKISVKTRIGIHDPEEFHTLLSIYNRFPIEELIIHPRTLDMKYKGFSSWDAYSWAVDDCSIPIVYNGDILCGTTFIKFHERFPEESCVMLGRGLLINPGFLSLLETGQMPGKERLRRFHDRVFSGYKQYMPGDKVVLFRMKELWMYMSHIFEDSKKEAKQIKKAQNLETYLEVVDSLFSLREVTPYDNRIFPPN